MRLSVRWTGHEVAKALRSGTLPGTPAGPPNPGVQGANVDDIPTGEGPHPDVEAPQKESVDVSLYLESFRFPSK